MTPEYITAAAVKRNDGVIVEDKDHSRCINKSPKGTCVGKTVEQGFMTSEGRFVNRREAGKIAFCEKQIKNDPKGGVIFSEEIWVTGNCKWSDTSKKYIFTKNIDLIEWFDPYNEKHITAYKHLNKHGVWPKGFIPEYVTVEPNWNLLIINKLADCWIKHFDFTNFIKGN
jgi:hypothetical protein